MSEFILNGDKFTVTLDTRPPNRFLNNGWLCYGKNAKRLVPFPIKSIFGSKYKYCIETENAIFFYVGRNLNKFRDHIYKCTYTVKQMSDYEVNEYTFDKNKSIAQGRITDTDLRLVGTEISIPLKQIHKFMSKEHTVKTTKGGSKQKYIPCIISIRDGNIFIDYDSSRKIRNRKRTQESQKLSKDERRAIRTEKRKLKNCNLTNKEKAYRESIIDYI